MNIFTRLFVVLGLLVSFPLFSVAGTKTLSDPSEGLVWAGCGITKKAFMQELAKAYESKTGIKITLQGGGATKGIRSVSGKKIHIGGACRPAMEFNTKERYVREVPVAWDAIVFVVNKSNPVDNITIQQVKDIYNGKIINWKALGGNDEPIDLYVRKSDISGVGMTLRELVFNDYDKVFTKRAHTVKSSGPAEKAVVKSKTAITATGISSAKRRDVKLLKVNGVMPNTETIKSGNYMLYRPLYLLVRMDEKNPIILKFIDYATSDEGMEIIRNTGTVPYLDALNLLSNQFKQQSESISSGF